MEQDQPERTIVEVMDGNKAVAYGVLLSRPDVVAVYPITPQSPVGEWLSRFRDEGLTDAEVVNVEGENSSMGVCCSASVVGGRVFTATSSWGLLFMYDGLLYAAGYRIPVVMTNANRETPGIFTIGNSNQDMMSVRDSGWIQIDVESCQEILDTVIMAYRLAEDPDILLPVMVCYDGFYLSYRKSPVELPAQNAVDDFLAVVKNKRLVLSPDDPKHFGKPSFFPRDMGEGNTEFRYLHSSAHERAKKKFDEVDREFARLFHRGYGGQIEEYRMEDAELVLITMGSCAGTAKVVVDRKRQDGIRVGLVKVRLLRPFPRERLVEALRPAKAACVIDRSVCFGWHCGHLYMELKAALGFAGSSAFIRTVNCIAGLSNLDITEAQIERAIDLAGAASRGDPVQEVTWVSIE